MIKSSECLIIKTDKIIFQFFFKMTSPGQASKEELLSIGNQYLSFADNLFNKYKKLYNEQRIIGKGKFFLPHTYLFYRNNSIYKVRTYLIYPIHSLTFIYTCGKTGR